MNTKKTAIAALLFLSVILALTGVYLYLNAKKGTGQDKVQQITDTTNNQKAPEPTKTIKDTFVNYAITKDISGGTSTGEFGFSFSSGKFMMKGEFLSIPALEGDNFYEGWLVNPKTSEFISTGKLSLIGDMWVNTFESDVDYSAYSKYVLTLEPNDGDPAPAKHIAEGIIEVKEVSQNPVNTVQAKNGYVSLSEYQANKEAYDKGKVVMFFNARWCPTCKVLDESLKKQASSFPADLTVVDLDYDKVSDLRSKYGVAFQHSLVQVDTNGAQIKKWSGGGDLQSITDQLK